MMEGARRMGFNEAIEAARAFRDERDWKQFHNPKDLAISISIEAAELLEVFQWSGTDLDASGRREELEDELADVLVYCQFLADAIGADIPELMLMKLRKNAEKYPAEKARGNARKYTEL